MNNAEITEQEENEMNGLADAVRSNVSFVLVCLVVVALTFMRSLGV